MGIIWRDGTGDSPDDVVFAGARGVYVDAMDPQQAGSLDTFWRSGDNFRHEAANGFRWAVSQAAPLRRIHAAGDLELFDPTARVNYASGGYLGNSIVEGSLILGSQQQWISERADERRNRRRRWSNVYVGCAGAVPEPSAAGAEQRVSVVDQAPVIAAEALPRHRRRRPLLSEGAARGQGRRRRGARRAVPRRAVRARLRGRRRAARRARDQRSVAPGLDVVLAPGIFQLDDSIRMARPGAVVMGLGYATPSLAPASGAACVIATTPEACAWRRSCFRRARCRRGYLVAAALGRRRFGTDPSVLSDVFCRVGGPGPERPRERDGPRGGEPTSSWTTLALARPIHAELAPGEQPRHGPVQ